MINMQAREKFSRACNSKAFLNLASASPWQQKAIDKGFRSFFVTAQPGATRLHAGVRQKIYPQITADYRRLFGQAEGTTETSGRLFPNLW